MPAGLLIVHVHVRVKPDAVEPFKTATLANAVGSRREVGVVRFDILQDRDDPTRFVLVEIYRSAEAATAHKETIHYAAWRGGVTDMMAENRRSAKYVNVSPDDAGW